MARATPAPDVRVRRPARTVVPDLLEAAAAEFAAHGYDGASTRRIAERAGAHQPQINYHFSSKEQLWRATVDRLFVLLDARMPTPGLGARPDDVFAAQLRAFLRFSAEHPELDRIINLEATADSDRLTWLVAAHLRPRLDLLADAWGRVVAAGAGADVAADEVWELITSFGAMHFANAPMLGLLGIRRGDGHTEWEAHADRVEALLLPGRGRRT